MAKNGAALALKIMPMSGRTRAVHVLFQLYFKMMACGSLTWFSPICQLGSEFDRVSWLSKPVAEKKHHGTTDGA